MSKDTGFSLTCGKRIAVLKKDQKIKDKFIYLYNPHYKFSSDCTGKKSCKCDEDHCGTAKYHENKSEIYNHLIAPKDCSFMVTPTNIIHQVSSLYLTGAPGVGKSDFVKQYLRVFIKMYPKIPIILISEGSEDKNLDPLITKRISPKQIVDEELEFNDFEDVSKEYDGLMIIFDDIDALPNLKQSGFLKRNTYSLMNSIINNSRKYNINVIFTSHTALGAQETSTMIRSCSNWVFFSEGITKQIEDCATKYFGFSDRQVVQLKKFLEEERSHWISVNRTIPTTIITEKSIFKLSDL